MVAPPLGLCYYTAMPNVSAYIRKADMYLWLALRKKTEAISQLLNALPPEAFATSPEDDIIVSKANLPYTIQVVGKPAFDRAQYLADRKKEREQTGEQPRRFAPTHTNLGDPINDKTKELVQAPATPPRVHTQNPGVNHVKEPSLPPAINNIPESIRGAFVPASSIRPPAPKVLQACCKGTEPCRHWVWDLNNGDGYINTLTGEKKEVT